MLEGGSTEVQGEVYDIDAERLSALDEFEECEDVYYRAPLETLGRETV